MKIGVIGAGTMGNGIAQIFAQKGHEVILVDSNSQQLEKSILKMENSLSKLVEKSKITKDQKTDILSKISTSTKISHVEKCEIVIEAIIEDLNIKHSIFSEIESIVSNDCIIASNTSSLSIASISKILNHPNRMLGIHFFNPATIMPLVEIIPSIQTKSEIVSKAHSIISSLGKSVVICKDTPGFLVNRVARPFYSEALRIYDEGIADFATIDWAMTEIGGFKMGPFTLMDYIGNDINYAVTESVFQAFYYDPRFKPSFTQKRLSEAGLLGRKTGQGYYNYSNTSFLTEPNKDMVLGKNIVNRILAMLINEAYDALFMQIATEEDIDKAMTLGVNYPKGLIAWSKEWGIKNVLTTIQELFLEYGEDRYRPNVLLKRMANSL